MSVFDIVLSRSDTSLDELEIVADDVWEVFRNHRRRSVIRYAASMADDEAVALGVLADDLAQREYGPAFSSSERKTVYVNLYQTHLEKLDDVGAVDYDDARGVIRPGPSTQPLAAALEAVSEVIN